MDGISEKFGHFLFRSKKHVEAEGEPSATTQAPPVGTGPYQFLEREINGTISYERTEFEHWRVTPDFQEFEMRFLDEASTSLAALITGEIHITPLSPDLIQEAESKGMVRAESGAPGTRVFGQFYCCYFSDDRTVGTGDWPRYPDSPLLKLDVRKALNRAIDRETIRENLVPQGEPMIINHFHPQINAWNPDWEARFPAAYGYDPVAAKADLAEAGYNQNDPLEINILLGNILQIGNANDVVESIAGYWNDIGVKTNLVQLDPAALRSKGRAFEFDNHFKLTGTAGTQVQGMYVYSTGRNSPSSSGFYSPELQNVYLKVNNIIDPQAQVAPLRDVGELFFNQYQHVPLWYTPVIVGLNPDVVTDYVFPGAVHSVWTHVENIKAAR